jgi:hypothetical protein
MERTLALIADYPRDRGRARSEDHLDLRPGRSPGPRDQEAREDRAAEMFGVTGFGEPSYSAPAMMCAEALALDQPAYDSNDTHFSVDMRTFRS